MLKSILCIYVFWVGNNRSHQSFPSFIFFLNVQNFNDKFRACTRTSRGQKSSGTYDEVSLNLRFKFSSCDLNRQIRLSKNGGSKGESSFWSYRNTITSNKIKFCYSKNLAYNTPQNQSIRWILNSMNDDNKAANGYCFTFWEATSSYSNSNITKYMAYINTILQNR